MTDTTQEGPRQSQADGDHAHLLQARLLAKAKIRDQLSISASSQPPTTTPINNRKRTRDQFQNSTRNQSGAASSSSLQNNQNPAASDQLKPLPNRIGKFVDYDLSTIKNSKGGFLLDNEEGDPRILKQRQQIEELKQQRLKQAAKFNQLPNLSLDANRNHKCKMCGSIELDLQFFQVFKVEVCPKCKNDHPEKFSLLTKTECKQDYLLTDPELKDSELLPHLLKPNPHQSTYSNMMLYLREQVEDYAFSEKKWGSAEALDEEFERRESLKKKAKDSKFKTQLKDLRLKTRTNLWHKRQAQVHVHSFLPTSDAPPSNRSGNIQIQKCSGCGLETECETF